MRTVLVLATLAVLSFANDARAEFKGEIKSGTVGTPLVQMEITVTGGELGKADHWVVSLEIDGVTYNPDDLTLNVNRENTKQGTITFGARPAPPGVGKHKVKIKIKDNKGNETTIEQEVEFKPKKINRLLPH
jgi:hypothetical protein